MQTVTGCFSPATAALGGDLKEVRMVHALKLLSDWMEEGKIRIEKRLPAMVTYHDPCALARYCEDLDSPRKILSALFEGGIREMATHKRMANCCGEGGMLPVYRPDLSKRVSQLRLEEAQETGATLLATGCPRCQDAFSRAMDPADKGETPGGPSDRSGCFRGRVGIDPVLERGIASSNHGSQLNG